MPRHAAAAILLALTLAAAAQAQLVGRPGGGFERTPDPFLGNGIAPGPSVERDVRSTRRQIERARDDGRLTRREAKALRREARRIEAAAERYAQGGLSASERRELETRARVLREQAARGTRAAKPAKRGS
jgi:hypothetical protein